MEGIRHKSMLSKRADRNTSASTNDIDAGLAAAPKQLRQNIIFYQWAHNFFFPRSCSDLATWIYSRVLLHRREPRPMSDSSTKKRKRALLAVEDEEPQHRQKTQVVETEDTDAALPATWVAKRPKKNGKSRQEKSERRLSKKQQKLAAVTSPTEEAGGKSSDPKSERMHEKDRETRAEEFSIVAGTPITKVDYSNDVPSPANDVLPAINGSKLRPKKKSRTKPTTMQADQNDVPANEPITEVENNSKAQRFILFIGNLPYSATTPQIESHFSKLSPISIRHSTDKATGRSKGFAFLEFSGYDKMKTCLKLYHHSIFDPGEGKDEKDGKHKDKKKPGRRINVELTVGGGGGRSEKRKEKIKGKNVKLEQERERRRVKELEDGETEAKKRPKNPGTDANATLQREKESDMGDIHPSRRGRVG
jgi:nucleolar protein 6